MINRLKIFYIILILSGLNNFTYSNSLSIGLTKDSEYNYLDTVTLKLKWKHQFQFAGYYAAIAKGYYKDAGLYVKLLEPTESENYISKVATNKIQYGIASSDLLLSYNAGFSVVLLANIFQHSPNIFIAKRRTPSDNIHDLAGKTIMLEEHANELIAYLKTEKIDLSTINFVTHNFSPQQFLLGNVFATSAYSTDEPYLLKEAGVKYNIFNPRSSGIDFFGDNLFTSRLEIKNHPKRVKAFLEASLKGWVYALEHSDEIVNLIYNNYSKRHSILHLKFEAQQTDRLIMHKVIEVGYVNKSRWQRIGEIYSELGMLPAKFSLDGFFYDKNQKLSFWNRYKMILFVLIFTLLILYVAIRFFRLNKKLHQESIINKEREKQLLKLEQKYHDLSDESPLPIIITSLTSGNVLYINKIACEKFKVNKQIALNKQACKFYANSEKRNDLLRKLQQQGYVRNMVVEMQDSGGVKFWALITANVINFESQESIYATILDITKRIKLEERLKSVNAAKDKFFSIIGHDLKSPFNALLGLSDLLLEKIKNQDFKDVAKYANIFRDTSQQTFNLLTNLLDWSLEQTGLMSFNPERINVAELAEDLTLYYNNLAKDKEINISTDINNDFELIADRNMLKTIITNLVSNAIKFTNKGGQIRISAIKKESGITFAISDSGVGIENSNLHKLFKIEETIKTKGTNNESGTGLGLILCKDFVERHNGKIWVESEIGIGSTFYFTISNKKDV